MADRIWKATLIDSIQAEAFFALIVKNREHIRNTFPVTLASCDTLEKTIVFIAEAKKKERNKDGYYFYLKDIATDLLIGYLCIKNINKNIGKCELAYFIDKEFNGQGIISELVSDVLAFCFDTIDMDKVFICTSKINIASQRVALKNGFVQEGILRNEFRNGGGLLEDIIYFGLLKSDYKNEK